jgi:hypothetical protein
MNRRARRVQRRRSCRSVRRPEWSLLPGALKGTIFLLALVTCASMMPVNRLPAASWQSAMSLGFISAVFDNNPLTALALKQDVYDWGMLAYCVGFGGSMIWFGSPAQVPASENYGYGVTSISAQRSLLPPREKGWGVRRGFR